MSVRVVIPAQLRPMTEGERQVLAAPAPLAEVLDELERRYPRLVGQLRYNHNGELRRTVNLYVNQQNVRFLEGVRTLLQAGDDLNILMAVAGG
jgi:molybdopterin synthase sulfur carrier subunit